MIFTAITTNMTYAINNEFYENFVLNPKRKKILKEKFSTSTSKQLNKLDRKPSDLSTKSVQNILKELTKKGLITDTKNINFDCYYRDYKIATFSSDCDVKSKVTH
jgi:predicted transcriptional regulator